MTYATVAGLWLMRAVGWPVLPVGVGIQGSQPSAAEGNGHVASTRLPAPDDASIRSATVYQTRILVIPQIDSPTPILCCR